MKLPIIILLLFNVFFSFSQSFQLNVEVQNPSKEINIDLITLKVDKVYLKKINVSNSSFKLELPKKGSYQFSFSYVGFETIEKVISIEKNTTISIKFTINEKLLNEVVISQNRLSDIDKPTMGVQKISIKELSKVPVLMGELDIQRGLQTLPGVTSVGEGANGLNIRGGSTDQNLMLLEGTPIYNPTHLFGLFSVVPSEAIGSIDLYKGSIPTRFGGRIASVIDLRSKDPSLNQKIIQGGAGLVASKLSIETPIIKDKMSVLLASRASFTDFLLRFSDKLKNYKGGFRELFGKLLFQPNQNNKLTLNYFGTNDFTKLIGVPLNPEGNSSEDTEILYSINNLSLKWNHAFKREGFYSNLLISNAVFNPKMRSPDPNLSITISNQVINRKLNYELILGLKNDNQLEFGIESQINEIQPGSYFQNNDLIRQLPIEKSLESAIYSSYQVSFGLNLKADLGIRYSIFNNLGATIYREYQNPKEPNETNVIKQNEISSNSIYNTYGGLEPRVSMAYALSKTSSIKANYTVSRQYVQIIANNTTPLPVSRWKTSDIHIKPQIGTMYSLGYYNDWLEKKANFSIEMYYRNTQNYTDVKMGSNFLLKNFVETELLQGLNKIYGVETMFSTQISRSVLLLNYTFSRSFNKIDGTNLFTQINQGAWYRSNFDRPHAFNANIKIQQSPIHHFSFAFTFISGRPFTSPQGLAGLENKFYPIYRERNNDRIPPYHRLDFSWNIENPTQKKGKYKGDWAFNIYNLYARKNIYSIFFNNSIGSLQAFKLSVFATAIPSISYNFIIK